MTTKRNTNNVKEISALDFQTIEQGSVANENLNRMPCKIFITLRLMSPEFQLTNLKKTNALYSPVEPVPPAVAGSADP